MTAGHSPMISQLQPGLVTVVHTSGESEKFFVSGGFAVTRGEGTAVSCPEAFPLSEFDPAVVKSGESNFAQMLFSVRFNLIVVSP